MPPTLDGRITPRTVRHRRTPSARLASRSVEGTSKQYLLRRARDEREHDDREREGSGNAALRVADDEQRVDEDPDDDRRQARKDVDHDLDRNRDPPRRKLRQIDGGQHTDG